MRREPTDRPSTPAGRGSSQGSSAGLDGETAAALIAFREARRRWVALGLAFDLAVTAIEMAAALDPAEPEVAAAVDEAREAFRDQGAVSPLALLERTIARGTARPPGGPRRHDHRGDAALQRLTRARVSARPRRTPTPR